MLIKKLNNPNTKSFKSLKSIILSNDFPWYWHSQSVINMSFDEQKFKNIGFYSHCFLKRPESTQLKISMVESRNIELACEVLSEIIHFNDLQLNYFLRINANCAHPHENVVCSIPHTDHAYEHKNIILYLTDAGGKTFVDEEYHDPNEDDVVMFDGSANHYLQTPKDKRRIVVVATFI